LTASLGIAVPWVGFMFLTYWAGIEQMNFEKLPAVAIGAAVGLLAAYGLQSLPHMMGTPGFVIALVAVLGLVYCQIMGWVPVAANMPAMVMLTIAASPLIQTTQDPAHSFPAMFASLALGVVFFPGLVWIGGQVAQRMAKKATA
jgi:hypothetical protein